MKQALAGFEQYLNRRFGQSSTPKHYLSDLRVFISIIGDKAPQDVTLADVDTFVDDQIARGLSPATINRRLACVHSFFQHCLVAGVEVSCHQLRHTFARRLVEAGLPVDSLSKLLGHSHLHTTQRYIDGADPAVRADFSAAMDRLQTTLIRDNIASSEPPQPIPPRKPTTASPDQLEKLCWRIAESDLPPWLGEALDAYISWRWPTWRAQTAYQIAGNMISTIRRIWAWLSSNRHISSWETFRRPDLEAWLQARCQEGLSWRAWRPRSG
jgi:hypothetical protein